MITDYDCWHPDHDAVDVAQVVATAMKNADVARGLVAALPGLLRGEAVECAAGCGHALDSAIMDRPRETRPGDDRALPPGAGPRALDPPPPPALPLETSP